MVAFETPRAVESLTAALSERFGDQVLLAP